MNIVYRSAMRHWAGLTVLLLATLGLPSLAIGDDHQALVIHKTQGGSSGYYCEDLVRLEYSGDTLIVRHTMGGGGMKCFAMDEIDWLSFDYVSTATDPPALAPSRTHRFLSQNEPNPFSLNTRVAFDLPRSEIIDLSIYGPDGRKVRTLLSGSVSAGHHEVHWDGRDEAGRTAGSGIYFYALRAPSIVESRRLIFMP